MFDPFESKSLSPFFTRERLPRRPYCTDDFEYGVQPRRLDIALSRRYMQLNPPGVCMWLQFDIDHSDAARRWHEVGLPPPTWTSCNWHTGKGHAVYGLQYPVRTDQVNKQTRLLAAVEEAITIKLDADRGYAGLLTKNPSAMDKDGRNVWSTLNWRKDGLHSLTDMLDWIDLPKISAKIKLPRIGFGRNVEVFDLTRFWAYSNFAHFGNETAWLMAVKERALVASRAHARPLNEREVEGIAKSVGCWVWRRRLDLTQEFRLKQSARGRLGGRPALGQPWTELGISRASYFNKLASGKLTVDGHRTDIERGLGLKPNQIQPVFNVFRFGDFYESI